MIQTLEKLPESHGGTYVKVFWEILDKFDDAGDGHVTMYHAVGASNDGYIFDGEAEVCDGQTDDDLCVEIDNVEFVQKK